MTYSVQYFIDKFEKIPDAAWIIGNFEDIDGGSRCCALGHCGARTTYCTVEARILAALRDLL